jgi:hypothetical protein
MAEDKYMRDKSVFNMIAWEILLKKRYGDCCSCAPHNPHPCGREECGDKPWYFPKKDEQRSLIT